MRTTLLLTFALCSTIAAQASYIPLFDGIRAAIVDRQVAISNAPPIDAAGKKELNTLKVALKTVDKPSTSLKTDLTALAKVVAGINKGASNETFSFEFASAISNYVQVLALTNDTLQAELSNATNNVTLKQKAQDKLSEAVATLAAILPATDPNGAAKNLGTALKQFLVAAKAVTAAVNAKPVPIPNPKAGTALVIYNGQAYSFKALFPPRVAPAIQIYDQVDAPSFQLGLLIGASDGPGTYNFALSFTPPGGTQVTVTGSAEVTTSTATVIAGHFETGGVNCQFSAKRGF